MMRILETIFRLNPITVELSGIPSSSMIIPICTVSVVGSLNWKATPNTAMKISGKAKVAKITDLFLV